MLHHVPTGEKGKTMRSIRRVLKLGGEFHMLDFEGPEKGAPGILSHFLLLLLILFSTHGFLDSLTDVG